MQERYEGFDPARDRAPLRLPQAEQAKPREPRPLPLAFVLGSDGRLYCSKHAIPTADGGYISAPAFECPTCYVSDG